MLHHLLTSRRVYYLILYTQAPELRDRKVASRTLGRGASPDIRAVLLLHVPDVGIEQLLCELHGKHAHVHANAGRQHHIHRYGWVNGSLCVFLAYRFH